MALRPVQLISLVVPVGLLLASAFKLFAFFHQRNDIWWTPLPTAVPLEVSGDRVEVYARGTNLPVLLQAEQVRIGNAAGSSVLAESDVRVRFNNWDRVRAERIPLLVAYSFTVGAMLVLVAFTLTGHLRPKPRGLDT